jgi:RNA polymerase sigma factor (sigma-70 family)
VAGLRTSDQPVIQNGYAFVTKLARCGLDQLPVEQRPDYGELYREHYGRVLRLCRLLLMQPEEAEDAAQEVFVRALGYWGDKGVPESWSRWLARVAINTCRDHRRSGWWKRRSKSPEEFNESDYADDRPLPEETAIKQEQYKRIWQRFRKLSRRQQEVFALRYFEGWSTEETGRALGLTTGSVKRHLSRAIDNLRKSLVHQL